MKHPAIEQSVRLREICLTDDGYYHWCPSRAAVAIDANALRAIADHLDELNADWDRQVRESLALLTSPDR